MATAKSKAESFTESVLFEAPMTVDRENGLVTGVKILGPSSKNGRTYSEKAMREAVGLYEGAKVNIDHPTKAGDSRSYRDRFGKLESVEYRQGKGLYGNLRFNPKHALAEQFAWDAENSPESTGLSHNAEGKTTGKRGSMVVESISKVNSVDVVADPATNISLREAEENTQTILEIIEAHKGDESFEFKFLEAFGAMLPQPGQPGQPQQSPLSMNTMGQPGMPGVPGMQQGNPEIKAAVVALVTAVAKDETFTPEEIGQKVTAAVKLARGVSDGDGTDGEKPADDSTDSTDKSKPDSGNPFAGTDEEKKKVKEQIEAAVKEATKSLTESIAPLTKELEARKILEGKRALVTPQLLGELMKCEDKAAMEALVENWTPAKLGLNKPTGIRGLQESKSGKYPDNHESFVRELKRR